MSVDQPNPPSIPPRKRPVGSASAHPAAPQPAPPHPAASQPPSAHPAAPKPAPSHPAAPQPAMAGPSVVAATGSMLKSLKSAVTGESSRTPATTPPAPGGAAPRTAATAAAPAAAPAMASAGAASASASASSAAAPARAAGETAPAATQAPASDPASPRQAAGRATAPGARMPSPAAAREGGPRRVRLSISRVDPWSVMKLSFLLSVAIGIMIVIAAAVVWFALDGLTVFTRVNDMITEIVGTESPDLDLLQYVEFSRVVSGATVVAVVDVVLLTALSTIGAFLYNITAALVGGVTLTLTDD